MSRLTPSAQAIHDEALTHPCSFCGATSGQACTTRITGKAVVWPHASRIAETRPGPKGRQALCCDCGQLRTISSGYHFQDRDPNRAQHGYFEDTRGWRRTGTLRCSACGRSTRHATLLVPDETDFQEQGQRFLLGGESPSKYWHDDDRERMRANYFEKFPRNPKLHHWYWSSEAEDAWAAGERTVTALCGATMPLRDPSLPSSERAASDDLVEPDRIDWDTEFEDHATGMWWVDMDCVDCLAVVNRQKLAKQRKAVLTKLLEASAVVETLDAAGLAVLSEHLDALIGGNQ